MRFLEFLIGELNSGNAHVRYQALVFTRKLIKGKDLTVDMKNLLESSQLIHPIVCRVSCSLD
jgi:hypothetical protein